MANSTQRGHRRLVGVVGNVIVRVVGSGTVHPLDRIPGGGRDLGELLTWAQDSGFEQLWLHRAYFNGPGVLSFPKAGVGAPSAPGWDIAGDHWLHCYRGGARFDPRPVDLVIPSRDLRSSFWDELAPDELVAALGEFETAMGVRYRRSPEATGSRLLTMLHDGARSLALSVAEMPPPALHPNTETDPYWIRDPLPIESGARWVIAFDANAAYLAATSSLRTGLGAVVHHTDARDATAAAGLAIPGYFYGRLDYEPAPGLPNPFRDGAHWFTTPTLTLAHELAAQVEIFDAYTWEGSSRPLESWYKVIREGRGYLIEHDSGVASRYALKAVKLLYGPFLGGRVASTKWERAGDPLYRPDWRHFVIATARANQYRTLRRCAAAGWTPFAIQSDCLYFLTADALGAVTATPGGVRIGTNPGAYKFVGATHTGLADTVAALDSALTPRRRLKKLQSAMRSQDADNT